VEHRSAAELEAGLEEIRRSPADEGTVELIVRRPAEDEREVLEEGALDRAEGLVGDAWRAKAIARANGGAFGSDNQLTVMNARVVALVAGDPDRRALAGDQLYVDLDLSAENLSPGTRLALGSAVIEITALPHTGCGKFTARFGSDAARFVNSAEGRTLRLRGVNAKVVEPGTVRRGDPIRKV
jgi:MOSC domain-containing protein YiiM